MGKTPLLLPLLLMGTLILSFALSSVEQYSNVVWLSSDCHGVVIPPQKIVTAAHCVVSQNGVIDADLTVNFYAMPSHYSPRPKLVLHNLTIIVHPAFNYDGKVKDLAVILLKNPIPVELLQAVPAILRDTFDATNATVLYYNYSKMLKTLAVSLLDFPNCSTFYDLTQDSLCVVEGTRTLSQGHSGSPLFCGEYLCGLLSYGPSDADKAASSSHSLPVVMTNLSANAEWINSIENPPTFDTLRQPPSILRTIVCSIVAICTFSFGLLILWKWRQGCRDSNDPVDVEEPLALNY